MLRKLTAATKMDGLADKRAGDLAGMALVNAEVLKDKLNESKKEQTRRRNAQAKALVTTINMKHKLAVQRRIEEGIERGCKVNSSNYLRVCMYASVYLFIVWMAQADALELAYVEHYLMAWEKARSGKKLRCARESAEGEFLRLTSK